MKKIKLITIGIFLLLFLSGCFQIERVIHVNKNGSGTIEETVLMSQEFINQMKQMAASFGGGEIEEKKDESEYHNVEDLKKDALKMGEGVKYVSSKSMEKDGKLGYYVIYSFDDITTIRIDENPADNMMSSSGMGEDKEDMYFKFNKGKISELTIIFPQGDDRDEYEEVEYEEEPESNSAVSDQDIKMMKAMYTGMKISVKVIVDGKIVQTNATHKDGNVITLTEMDFDVIMENEKAFKALAGSKDSTDEEMKMSMQNYPGFKADMNEEVVIKFK
ncbi:MAG: hypothetical protein KAS53_10450 [Candidatus Cloacimonetes bacterium]|nr:hypothetical protein [Candidatus Cloacimonadota bacterium]